MDLTLDDFAAAVGSDGPVAVQGHGTRRRVGDAARVVRAPVGIQWIQAAEMTVCCGAGTPVGDLADALAEHGQRVALPAGGTVAGALAVGRSGPRRLADGAMRDALLQARYVNAAGEVVTAGGPTVKNVSGFDLCRLLVGSWGTLGFLGEVILRTRPVSQTERWFTSDRDPWELLAALYRPTSLLWNGEHTWVLLEGDHGDVDAQARLHALTPAAGPPALPTASRWSMKPAELPTLRASAPGSFVAEIGVGVVHHTRPRPPRRTDPVVVDLHRRIKAEFDPDGRLNPGIDVLAVG